MNILADENIPGLAPRIGALGSLRTRAGRSIGPADLRGVDVLLVRSVTRVDRQLLAGSAVGFVGSCTAGTDHVDRQWLREAGIGFAHAPGANARSVVEYVLSALAWLSLQRRLSLPDRTVGIVGLGNIGGRLARVLHGLGVRCVGYDPYVDQGGIEQVACLDQLLAVADVLTLHTPLRSGGRYPTRHLFDAQRLSQLRSGAVLVNASRGAVVDNGALRRLLAERSDVDVVLDTWEGEPDIDRALLQRAALATPHIAGYSYDGKLRGVDQVCAALRRWLDRRVDGGAGGVDSGERRPDRRALPAWDKVCRLMLAAYDIAADDRRMRSALLGARSPAAQFERLRRDYPLRRELGVAALPEDHAGADVRRATDGDLESLSALLVEAFGDTGEAGCGPV